MYQANANLRYYTRKLYKLGKSSLYNQILLNKTFKTSVSKSDMISYNVRKEILGVFVNVLMRVNHNANS